MNLVAGVVQDAGDLARARRGQHGLHLHGREHDQGLALRDLVADLDLVVDDDGGHGRADRALVVGGLVRVRVRVRIRVGARVGVRVRVRARARVRLRG